MTGTSPSDCLVSYPRHSLGERLPLYSQADWSRKIEAITLFQQLRNTLYIQTYHDWLIDFKGMPTCFGVSNLEIKKLRSSYVYIYTYVDIFQRFFATKILYQVFLSYINILQAIEWFQATEDIVLRKLYLQRTILNANNLQYNRKGQ